MTAIIAVRSNVGLDCVVVASDRQISEYDEDDQLISTTKVKKIYQGDNWIMAAAGLYDKKAFRDLRRFYQILRGDKRYGSNDKEAKEILERAIQPIELRDGITILEQGMRIFQEIRDLNTVLINKGINADDLYSFIFAFRNSGVLSLFEIDEFGNLSTPFEDRPFTYARVGSGYEKVDKFIEDQVLREKIDPDRIDPKGAFEIVRGALKEAEQDPGSGLGYDIISMTMDGIYNEGDEIRRDVEAAEEKSFERVINKQRYRSGESSAGQTQR